MKTLTIFDTDGKAVITLRLKLRREIGFFEAKFKSKETFKLGRIYKYSDDGRSWSQRNWNQYELIEKGQVVTIRSPADYFSNRSNNQTVISR